MEVPKINTENTRPETLPAIKTIALIAHDGMKERLTNWASEQKSLLAKHNLCATGTTGRLVAEKTGLQVTRYLSGPLGGDQQIGALIAEQKVHALIFFWDPLSAQPHDPDVKALLRLAALYDIPVACNRASAQFLITSPLFDSGW